MSWESQYPDALRQKVSAVDKEIAGRLSEIDAQALDNQAKVLQAFKDQHVSESNFAGTNGYGNDDEGRDTLEAVYAEVFHTEAALVRPQFVSGTHAIGVALLGNLRPKDQLLYLTGEPYDTLQQVVGMAGNGNGSLKEFGIGFDFVPLKEDGSVDFELAKTKINKDTKMVVIQRSRGYDVRESFTVAQIKKMIDFVKAINKDIIIFVDNSYGEFSEREEPTDVGADLMAGSLIKNPGGGLAQTGAYIAGRADLVENASYRMTVPGIGTDEGATNDQLRWMFQGFFEAPHVVAQAIKGAIYEAALLAKQGLQVSPTWDEARTDLIQTITFGNPDDMVKFAGEIQHNSPVDSFVTPVPDEMAGYEDKVVMAAGTFVQGASIEFSADGPIRPPYILYLQGGLTYEHIKIAITNAVNETFYQHQ
ncbi:aminotransferase class I/II-fold pyridoxal phosphate-dependent enzyme [Lactobacillus selangorensis]|nr:methionine gamma-lyase family protein [Lactobacillus selangorensis]